MNNSENNPLFEGIEETAKKALTNNISNVVNEYKNKPSFLLKSFAVIIALEFSILLGIMITELLLNLIK